MKRIACFLLAITILMTPAIGGCGRMTDSDGEDSEVRDVVKDQDDPNMGGGTKDPSGSQGEKEPEKAFDYHNWVPVCKADTGKPLFGFADPNGRMIIEPRFGYAEPFYDCGLAVAGDEQNKIGLIDAQGNYVVAPTHEYISYDGSLFTGYSYSTDGSKTTAYDQKGKQKFVHQGSLGPFSDGLAYSYGQGYVNTDGELVLALAYDTLGSFCNGMALVGKDYGRVTWYIDKEGKDLTEEVSSGLSLVYDENSGLFGYDDKDGKRVIECQFTSAEPFLDGFAIVSVASESYASSFGLIDTSGNFVVGPNLAGIRRMKNGTFAVGKEVPKDTYIQFGYFESSPRALYSKDLSKKTDLVYTLVEDFDSDTLCVTSGDSISFLDASLEQVKGLPVLKGRGTLLPDGAFLRGRVDALMSLYDRRGNLLMRDEGRTLLGDGLEVTTIFYLGDHSEIAYPFLNGLSDDGLKQKINKLMAKELADPWIGYTSGYEVDEFNFTDIHTWFSSCRMKSLFIVDQMVDLYMGGAHGSHFRKVLFVDLQTGASYGFDDLFKDPAGARERLSNMINETIQAGTEEQGYMVDAVEPDQIQFFTLKEKSIIVYFGEYEIGPYAMGMPEFEIPFADIQDLINTEGAFWKSFN